MFKLQIKPSNKLRTKYGTALLGSHNYYQISTTKEGNSKKLLHRLIFEDFYGKIPKDCHIHHKDKNRLNNCIMNLQILPKSEHIKVHMTGENHPRFNKKHSLESIKKMRESKLGAKNNNYGKHFSETHRTNLSISQNSTGYFRVHKAKKKGVKQGFVWRYQYYENGKKKAICKVNFEDLENEVKKRKLEWKKLNIKGDES